MRMNLEIAAINVVSEGTFPGPKETIVFIFSKQLRSGRIIRAHVIISYYGRFQVRAGRWDQLPVVKGGYQLDLRRVHQLHSVGGWVLSYSRRNCKDTISIVQSHLAPITTANPEPTKPHPTPRTERMPQTTTYGEPEPAAMKEPKQGTESPLFSIVAASAQHKVCHWQNSQPPAPFLLYPRQPVFWP